MRLTNSVRTPSDPYLSNTLEPDVHDTPRIPNSQFVSGFPGEFVRDPRRAPSTHHHGPSLRAGRRPDRDNRRSVSGSESSSDEYRSDNPKDTRPAWREGFPTDHGTQGYPVHSSFTRPPSYPLDSTFGLRRYPSQSWVPSPDNSANDHVVTTTPLEFRPVQRVSTGDYTPRISSELGHHDNPRAMAGIQAYYPYPHPEYMRLPAPLGTLQGRPAIRSSTQRVPPRLRTSQACEKCRKRKVKCTGDRPTCGRCAVRGFICEYATSEKDDKYKGLFLRGPEKARQERRMKGHGQDSTTVTRNAGSSFDNESQSDRRPSDSSSSSSDSNGVDIGHAQHEERRYLAYPHAASGHLGYATIQGFGPNDQPSYRRLSVKDLLNPRPPTPLNNLFSKDNAVNSVFQTPYGLESNEHERHHEHRVVEFPSTSPRITPDRLPVMLASEVLDPTLVSQVHSSTGDEAGTRLGRTPRDSPFSPPPSFTSGSLASMEHGTDNVSDDHDPGVRGDFHTMRGKDCQESDSSVSSHDPSPISEIESV